MRIQPRNRVSGQYRHSGWYNFKKKKRGWREYAFHPITATVFALVAYVGMNTAWAMNEVQKIDGRFEIYNGSSIREDSEGDGSSPSINPNESTGETVSAVSVSAEKEEGQAPLQVQPPSSIEAKILKAWEGTGKGHIAVAVAKSESGLRSNAMGWNCHYTIQGMKYSKACNPEDRPKAWSVDCGVMQINHIGKTCPAHLFNPDENIKIGKEKYDNSEKRIGIGFYPWMAFRNNLHLKYL